MSIDLTFPQLQADVATRYSVSNDRWFDHGQMTTNIVRYSMRALKATRRLDDTGSAERLELNLAIAMAWFASCMNRLHLDIGACVAERFPGICPKCSSSPCCCGVPENYAREAAATSSDESINRFQGMFEVVYPPNRRTLPDAAMHYVEEVGEFAEAILIYRLRNRDEDIPQIALEAADLVSCALGVWNSLGTPASRAIHHIVGDGCHACGGSICVCSFDEVMGFEYEDRF